MHVTDRWRASGAALVLLALAAGCSSATPEPTPTTSGSGFVDASEHQFYLAGVDGIVDYAEPDVTGTIAASPGGGAFVHTSVSNGRVPYTWAVHDDEPAVLGDAWEDVGEVVVEVVDELHVLGWGGGSWDEMDLAFEGPGRYVVRCSASGRDLDWDIAADPVRERYHFDVWPAPQGAQDRLIRAGSSLARSTIEN
ncbi:MAG: hypothetical protein NVV66_08300 [Cellulomonas sp.]|uniref:hypothetical protein n=1 Tax=Cellulomonas sp. TaxID=40001 RepID=UPI00258D878F|nr:hypothetical protein [Cellulomonas sp.]MCR6704684.1 hypothetical protein [Cellulomonas sp.]